MWSIFGSLLIGCGHLLRIAWVSFWKLIFMVTGTASSQRKPIENGPVLPVIEDKILTLSARQILRKLKKQDITCEDVMKCFIQRANAVNPMLNCVVDQRYRDALDDSRKADDMIRKAVEENKLDELFKKYPLLGLPVSTKDAIAVKGLKLTVGLILRKDFVSKENARVIERLIEAGAIPFCVTNVSEVCMHWESANNLHGRTNNPYDFRRTAGGSSGGEGAFQTSCGSAISIGADIGGSIRIPSFINGIFGFKPSASVVPNAGHYPIPSGEHAEFMVIGPMCRRAEDLSLVFPLIVDDPVLQKRLATPVDIRNLRFFYMESNGGHPLTSPVAAECQTAVQLTALHFQEKLGLPVKKVNLDKIFHSVEIWLMGMMAEDSAHNFSQEMGNREFQVNICRETFRWMFGKSHHTLPAIILGLIDTLGNRTIKNTWIMHHFLKIGKKLRAEFDALLGDNGVFLYPTMPNPAPFHYEPLIRILDFGYTGVFNTLKLPSVACPTGLTKKGIPTGLQCVAGFKQDHLLIPVAEEIERAFGGWRNPSAVRLRE